MNILIVSVNQNRQPVAVMPYGACIIAEAASAAGHSVRFLDFMFKARPLVLLARELERFKADVVGISVRNIDNNDMLKPASCCAGLRSVVDTVKEKSGAQIVLGGAAASIMPEELMRSSGLSFAVSGGGEEGFLKLIAAFESGKGCDTVPGLARIESGRFIRNRFQPLPAMKGCRVPDFNRWIDVKAYVSRLSTVPLQSKRGCPFSCVYCTYKSNEGSIYQLCPPKSVALAVDKITGMSLRDIEFVDNVFNAPYGHALSICNELIRRKTAARLLTVELNPHFLDDELLSAMELAGFKGIGITAESASDSVLAALEKGYSSASVYRAAEAVRRHNIPCLWMFLLGGPGETAESVRQTLRFAERYIRPQDSVFFNVGVRIYPGTKLEEIARREGVSALPAAEMLNPVFYVSPSVAKEWLVEEVRKAVDGHTHYMGPDSLQLPYLSTMFRIGRAFGMKNPIWKYTRILRRGLKIIGANI